MREIAAYSTLNAQPIHSVYLICLEYSVRFFNLPTILNVGSRNMTTECTPASEEAVRLVLAHRTMLNGYIRGMIHDPTLAEDAFSDVTLAILRSWDRYDPTRSFEAWARGVARRVAFSNLRRESRQPCLLDQEVLELIALEIDAMGTEATLDSRKEMLHGCVQRLPPRHQQLIQFRYFENRSYPEISALVGKSVGSLYVIFNRVHKALSTCIERESRRQ